MKSARLKKPDIFNFKESLWFLDRGFDDCLHEVDKNSVTKAISYNDQILLFNISEHDDQLILKWINDSGSIDGLEIIKNFTSVWLDLERNLTEFYRLGKKDEVLSQLIQNYSGLRLITIPDLFEAICWCIIGQQINLSFAHKMKTGLVEKYGGHIEYQGKNYYTFPKPLDLVDVKVNDLKSLQFSRQKADYVLNTAKIFVSDQKKFEEIGHLEHTSEMIKELCKLRGVGEWTANYVCMKTFKRMDAITYGDAGLLNGLKNLQNLESKPDRQTIDSFFRKFPGWESYVVFYIWRSLS